MYVQKYTGICTYIIHMCMCICLYVYIYITSIYSFIDRYLCIQSMYVNVYRNIQTHMHMYIFSYMCVCTCMCVHIYVCLCIDMCVYIYVCVFVYMYTHTHISHLFQFTCQWFSGCFHILTIGNNAIMNIVVHIYFPISVSFFSR